MSQVASVHGEEAHEAKLKLAHSLEPSETSLVLKLSKPQLTLKKKNALAICQNALESLFRCTVEPRAV